MLSLLAQTFLSLGLLIQPAQANVNYQVVPTESSIEWAGHKKIGGETHVGALKFQSGKMTLSAEGLPTQGELVVDMNSITNADVKDESYNKKLVGHLKSADFFKTEDYPTATFSFSQAKKVSEGVYDLVGKLKIRGQEQDKTVRVNLASQEKGYTGTADVVVDRTKYGVTYKAESSPGKKEPFYIRWFKSGADKIIKNNMDLKVKVVLQKAE